jgi:hypothetical protein
MRWRGLRPQGNLKTLVTHVKMDQLVKLSSDCPCPPYVSRTPLHSGRAVVRRIPLMI